MKTIQVSYTTKERTWLADINFIGMDIYVLEYYTLVSKVYNILCERYGEILEWSFVKEYENE